MDEVDAIKFERARLASRKTSRTKTTHDRSREFEIDLYSILLANCRNGKSAFRNILESHYSDYYRPYFDGSAWKTGKYSQVQSAYFERIVHLLVQFSESIPDILEIGAGSGELARFLSSKFNDTPILCTDKMPSSVTLINEIANREGGNVRSTFIDIDDPQTTLFKNKFVVSSYALMYLGLPNSSFFETLLQSEPLGGLFLEPIFDDIDPSNPFAAERKTYYEDNSYNKEWYSQFCSLMIQKGNYEIIYRKSLFFAHNSLLPITAILWKKTNS